MLRRQIVLCVLVLAWARSALPCDPCPASVVENEGSFPNDSPKQADAWPHSEPLCANGTFSAFSPAQNGYDDYWKVIAPPGRHAVGVTYPCTVQGCSVLLEIYRPDPSCDPSHCATWPDGSMARFVTQIDRFCVSSNGTGSDTEGVSFDNTSWSDKNYYVRVTTGASSCQVGAWYSLYASKN